LSYILVGSQRNRPSPVYGSSKKPHQRGVLNLDYRRSSVLSSSQKRITHFTVVVKKNFINKFDVGPRSVELSRLPLICLISSDA